MSNRQGGTGWASRILIVLGVIAGLFGIAIIGFTGYCVSELSGLGGRPTFLGVLALMMTYGGPFLLAGFVLLIFGAAMRRGE